MICPKCQVVWPDELKTVLKFCGAWMDSEGDPVSESHLAVPVVAASRGVNCALLPSFLLTWPVLQPLQISLMEMQNMIWLQDTLDYKQLCSHFPQTGWINRNKLNFPLK